MFGLFGLECALVIIVVCNIAAFIAFMIERNCNRIRSARISWISEDDVAVEEYSATSILTVKKHNRRYYRILKTIAGFDFNSSLYTREYIYKVCFIVTSCVIVLSFVLAYFLDRIAIECAPFESIAVIRLYFTRVQGKYNTKLTEQIPEVVAMMARCLKVGVSLSRTLEIVASQAPDPTRSLFQDVVHKVAVGKELGEALEDLADSGGIKEYRFFSIIVRLQSRTGGGLAEILDSFATTIRKRLQARKKAFALASEARTSCYVLAGLPIFMAILMGVMNPKYISVLYTTKTGLEMLYTAVALFVMGIVSMFSITKFTLR